MKQLAGWAAAFLLIAVAALIAWQWPKSSADGLEALEAQGADPVPAPAADSPGGRGLSVETYSSGGGLEWHLSLDKTAVDANDADVLTGSGVTAEYHGSDSTISLTAEKVVFESDLPKSTFDGNVHLSAKGIDLKCSELVWDGRAHSFSASGGYTLARGSSVLNGRELWADEGFKTVRSQGPTRGVGDLP